MSESTEAEEVHKAYARRGRGVQGEKAPVPRAETSKDQRQQGVMSRSVSEDILCDAILVGKTVVGGEENMKEEARGSLQQALERDDFYVEGHERLMFVANGLGLEYGRLRGDFAEMTEKMEGMRETIIGDAELIGRQSDQILTLEGRVRDLTRSLEAYKRSRQRYISVFKRDKLANITAADKDIIEEGNQTVHGGDAITDSLLYTSTGGRDDVAAFRELYGLLPETVEKLKLTETINALNAHAGVRASKYVQGTERFYQLFGDFVQCLQSSGEGFDERYLYEPNTPLFNAYWLFMDARGTEVIRVREEE